MTAVVWPPLLVPSHDGFTIRATRREVVHVSAFTGAEQRRALDTGVRYEGGWALRLVKPERAQAVRELLARLSTGDDFLLPLLWGGLALPWTDVDDSRAPTLRLLPRGGFEWAFAAKKGFASPAVGDWFAAYAGAPAPESYLQTFQVVEATTDDSGRAGTLQTASRPRAPEAFAAGAGARVGHGAAAQVIRARFRLDGAGRLAMPAPTWGAGDLWGNLSFGWEEAW